MSDDDWGDGEVTLPFHRRCNIADFTKVSNVTSTMKNVNVEDDDFGGDGGRGSRGDGGFRGGGGSFNQDDDNNGERSGGGFRGRGGGGRGGYNRDEDGGGDRPYRGRFRGRGGGRGGYNGGGGGSDNEEGGDSGSSRGRGGYRGGRDRDRDRNRDNDEGKGEGGDEKKPRPYVPGEDLVGDAAFADRNQYYEGSGINFTKYDNVKFEITGDGQVKSYTSFDDMNLRPLVRQNLDKVGYKTPTPIQRHASPQLFAGLAVIACAQTGSRKTCAFLLPVVNTLLSNQNDLDTETRPVKPECLVLAPTRELAIQISREARLYAEESILRTVVCYGGTAIFSQRNQLQSRCKILVATPGRLKQFVEENIINS